VNAIVAFGRRWCAPLSVVALAAAPLAARGAQVRPADLEMPRYAHILVIIAENKSFAQIIGPGTRAPNINRLSREYGYASEFYAEVHPSEGNYVAMLGGDTFGIHDDDAFYCKPGERDPYCPNSAQAGYKDHTVTARSLMDQLQDKGLSWKAYMQSLPAPGSLAVRWPAPDRPVTGLPAELYAVKHNGFLNFQRIQQDPERATRLVDFEQLYRDLAAGQLPNYAHIVPNQCDDMHGCEPGPNTPENCRDSNSVGLIERGDRVIADLVQRIMDSAIWSAPEHTAIVITFDENDQDERHAADQGCCGFRAESTANFGGGHIPTIVITNHGPRKLVDATRYNHYSLLRTTEAAFGIGEFLRHAGDERAGVVTMTALFAVSR
jgi:phosphatidylinositol-3-phosphatase